MPRLPVAGSIVTSVVFVYGCAAPPIAHPQPGVLAAADAALLQGCYDCLLEARASYRRLADSAERPRLVARVFEADLLIALREKELDLPPSDARIDAHRIASELPPDLEAERYLALVDAVPSEPMGQPRRDNAAFRVARLALVDRLDTERAWLANGRLRAPVRDYLRLALDCAYPVRGDLTRPVVPTAPLPAASPLLVYRAAICDVELAPAPPALSAVRAREPRFVETSFFLASLEIAHAAGDGPGQAKAHLAEVRARFPTSPAITFLTGSYGRLVGDWAEALRFYDQTLALRPAHDQALLGRTICLTNLARSQEAIGAATQLIGLGAGPDLDEAYYWRAWNRYTLARLDDARADIAAAKQLMITPNVLSLAGLIEHDQRDLDPAQADLEAAIAANDQDCTARWYLGLVHRERKHWLDAGHAFEGAMTCYRDRAQETADRIRVLQARAELDPDYRARQITSLEVSVASDTRQQHAAALTAANYDAAGGDLASAKPLAEIAGEDPTLADRVAKLRALLDKPRRSP